MTGGSHSTWYLVNSELTTTWLPTVLAQMLRDADKSAVEETGWQKPSVMEPSLLRLYWNLVPLRIRSCWLLLHFAQPFPPNMINGICLLLDLDTL